MPLAIRAEHGDWGGAQLSDIEAVALSAADSLAALDESEAVAISLKPTANEDMPPKTHSAPNPSGEFVVELNVRGNLWARLAYQFAHEFCHVLAGPSTWPGYDRFAWLEEALAETASLFALRSMATSWATDPPYAVWRSYSSALADYEARQAGSPAHSLSAGVPFSEWLARRLPLLEADAVRRDDNTIVAKELLPIFSADQAAWRAVRSLHTWPRISSATFPDFISGWAEVCPSERRGVVKTIGEVLVVGTH